MNIKYLNFNLNSKRLFHGVVLQICLVVFAVPSARTKFRVTAEKRPITNPALHVFATNFLSMQSSYVVLGFFCSTIQG